MNTKLTLLGIWNIAPFDVSLWLNDLASKQLERLTGTFVRTFTSTEDGLYYGCVFTEDFEELKQKLDRAIDTGDGLVYIQNIYDDYDNQVPALEKLLEEMQETNFSKLSNSELIKIIKLYESAWTSVTMHIWYAVFMDIWYPSIEEHEDLKEVAAKARDHAGHIHAKSDKISEKLLNEIASRLSLANKEVEYLFPSEITALLENQKDTRNKILDRMQFCVTHSADREYKIFTNKEARELVVEYDPPKAGTKSQKELKGIPASKGTITGIVRVVTKRDQFDSFKDGEILVALQTMVDYLPVMRKAKAILTEFGGLTSHAAIVSRELGVPAVVGIPNLIASVKDGDTVEIDAKAGTIKVLS